MNALTCVIASDDDVDAASARTGKKEHVRSRLNSAADAADAQNIEKRKGRASTRPQAPLGGYGMAAKTKHIRRIRLPERKMKQKNAAYARSEART